jgi:glycosyltransferase involved in cell wall biosynthesis
LRLIESGFRWGGRGFCRVWRYGARVIPQDARFKDAAGRLSDFGGARNQCLDAAKHDWFLYIDSDESITEGLRDEVRAAVETGGQSIAAYRVPIGIMIDGVLAKFSTNYPGYQFRFFNRASGARFVKPVHERIELPRGAHIGTLRSKWMIHTERGDWDKYIKDGRRYRELASAHFSTRSWPTVVATLLRNMRSAVGVLLRYIRITAIRGTEPAVPFSGEFGRFADPLLLSGDILRHKIFSLPKSDNERGIAYIAFTRMPTERAHGVQIMKTCEAFCLLGGQVELFVPKRKNELSGVNPFHYYGIPGRFSISELRAPDFLHFGSVGFLASITFFALAARNRLLRSRPRLIFSRDELILVHLSGVAPIAWESHTGSWNSAARRVASCATAIIVISEGLKDFYISKGVPKEKIVVAEDGVDLASFGHVEDKKTARKRLGLEGERIALYAGGLDSWKGVDTFFKASEFIQGSTVCAVIGGTEKEISELQPQYPRVRFLGAMPYRELPNNLAAADVLVLPNTLQNATSSLFTSPLKLFAYMASGKPIVASDVPSVRSVLSEDSAFFVSPDSPEALAEGISQALASSDALGRGKRAQELAMSYTWEARAKKILSAVNT